MSLGAYYSDDLSYSPPSSICNCSECSYSTSESYASQRLANQYTVQRASVPKHRLIKWSLPPPPIVSALLPGWRPMPLWVLLLFYSTQPDWLVRCLWQWIGKFLAERIRLVLQTVFCWSRPHLDSRADGCVPDVNGMAMAFGNIFRQGSILVPSKFCAYFSTVGPLQL